MQSLFKHVAHEYGIGAVFVTHDLREALVMGDAFARLEGGHLLQYPSREAFVADPESGVGRERAFWKSVGDDPVQPV
jgi:putrescine transport system ATP-binding protein